MKKAIESSDGLTVSQTKAIECLMAGGSITEAARAAGVSRVTIADWRDNRPNFKDRLALECKALDDRIARARKSLLDNVLTVGAAGAARLLQHVQSADAAKSLSAAKAAYAGAVALSKGNEDTGANFGPMFVLPAGVGLSFDTSPAPLPLTPAAVVVVDAEVTPAKSDK